MNEKGIGRSSLSLRINDCDARTPIGNGWPHYFRGVLMAYRTCFTNHILAPGKLKWPGLVGTEQCHLELHIALRPKLAMHGYNVPEL